MRLVLETFDGSSQKIPNIADMSCMYLAFPLKRENGDEILRKTHLNEAHSDESEYCSVKIQDDFIGWLLKLKFW